MPSSYLARREFLRSAAGGAAAFGLATCESSEESRSQSRIDLAAIPSPILFEGNALTAFRDPTAVYHDGVFWLYYSYVLHEPDGKAYNYTAYSTSRDLVDWSAPCIFTPRDETSTSARPAM